MWLRRVYRRVSGGGGVTLAWEHAVSRCTVRVGDRRTGGRAGESVRLRKDGSRRLSAQKDRCCLLAHNVTRRP